MTSLSKLCAQPLGTSTYRNVANARTAVISSLAHHNTWRSTGAQRLKYVSSQPARLICCQGLVNRLQNVDSSAETRTLDQSLLRKKLQTIISANSLEGFYPTDGQKLQAVLDRLVAVEFRQLATDWRIPVEMAYDLATLALYDIVIFADDSGSMAFEEKGQRIDDLNFILGRVAEVATMFDDDGINVRFMNSNVKGDGIKNAEEASALLKGVQFSGMTPLGTNLSRKVIKPFVEQGVVNRSLAKPVLVITITDGEPTGEHANTTFNTISDVRKLTSASQYGPKAVAFQFAQVGRDTRAQAFLEELDNHPVVGDMVDATSYFELEAEECARKGITLTPELWLIKLMVGAVDPYYDAQDEANLERSMSSASSWTKVGNQASGCRSAALVLPSPPQQAVHMLERPPGHQGGVVAQTGVSVNSDGGGGWVAIAFYSLNWLSQFKLPWL